MDRTIASGAVDSGSIPLGSVNFIFQLDFFMLIL